MIIIDIKQPVLDEDANSVGNVTATINIEEDSNIHGYVGAFVTALKIQSFTDSVILKGFKNYVMSEEGE